MEKKRKEAEAAAVKRFEEEQREQEQAKANRQAFLEKHRAEAAQRRAEKEKLEEERYVREQQEKNKQEQRQKADLVARRAKLAAEADEWEAERARKREERKMKRQEEEEMAKRAKDKESAGTDALVGKVGRLRKKRGKQAADELFDDFFDECDIVGVKTNAKEEVKLADKCSYFAYCHHNVDLFQLCRSRRVSMNHEGQLPLRRDTKRRRKLGRGSRSLSSDSGKSRRERSGDRVRQRYPIKHRFTFYFKSNLFRCSDMLLFQ